MSPLASQSFPASAQPVEAPSLAPMVAPVRTDRTTAAANDNTGAWKPSLLVQRRRRSARRAVHY
ncbi:hypothetical protein [Henriciella aquimarina]|uniref:hypothetical protein n=1 Tax=Henriciella aquimarina TaxID=545261 RepID=UPI000A02DF16|nr:hypothetical protein [Henriciella aquimarina]